MKREKTRLQIADSLHFSSLFSGGRIYFCPSERNEWSLRAKDENHMKNEASGGLFLESMAQPNKKRLPKAIAP